jgi:hypothetical protein
MSTVAVTTHTFAKNRRKSPTEFKASTRKALVDNKVKAFCAPSQNELP